jgi:hypothetical protein
MLRMNCKYLIKDLCKEGGKQRVSIWYFHFHWIRFISRKKKIDSFIEKTHVTDHTPSFLQYYIILTLQTTIL